MKSPELLPTAALTGAAALATLGRTAIEDHRLWTHQSIAFKSDRAEKIYRIAGSHLTDTKRWAGVHRVHHSTPDANLVNFVALADYIDWHGSQTTMQDGQLALPDEVYGLDPVLERIDIDTAYEIGHLAKEIVGGLYKPAPTYSTEEAQHILYDNSPKYFYEDKAKMRHDRKNPVSFDPANPPSLNQIRFLLRDPHSPALHREGIPGILRYNVPLYGYVEQNFADAVFRADDLQPDETDTWIRENRLKIRYAYTGAMVLANIAIGGRGSKEKIARNAFLGAAASGLAVTVLIAGGNSTNALGHGGDLKKLTFREFLDGTVHPKLDGTYETDSRSLGFTSLDEIGGQRTHHLQPNEIAYSLASGINKFIDAPFGTFLEFLATHGIIFKNGNNFENVDKRPDKPSEAIIKLQEARVKHLASPL
jgi:hypothetical protein